MTTAETASGATLEAALLERLRGGPLHTWQLGYGKPEVELALYRLRKAGLGHVPPQPTTLEHPMTQPLEQQDMALLIEALAHRDADPLTRFVRSLTDEPPFRARAFAEETIQLREELIQNVQRMLSETDPQRSAGYAAWVTKHAHEVAYRWSSLMRTVAHWSMYEAGGPYVVRQVGR